MLRADVVKTTQLLSASTGASSPVQSAMANVDAAAVAKAKEALGKTGDDGVLYPTAQNCGKVSWPNLQTKQLVFVDCWPIAKNAHAYR